MHRRVLKSLVPLVGAAALVAAPIALAAPASAAPVVSAAVDPDENHEWFWEDYLWEEEGIEALCVKDDSVDTPYVVPEIEDAFPAQDIEDAFPEADLEDLAYVLAVVKAAAGEEASELVWEPEAGDELSHSNGKGNSHVILCIAELEDETPPTTKPPTTKPPVTGPVVETDRVADTGPAAGLGLAAAATALIAGVGAMVVRRRRQGAHR